MISGNFILLYIIIKTIYLIYIYVYIYMGIDLKVPVRSFNCESRACYVGNSRESFFFEFAKVKFYFAKVGYYELLCKGH